MTGLPIPFYLVRHATAAKHGSDWPDDRDRPLTAEGIDDFRTVVLGLRALGVAVDVVLTSPLARARQTAELLAAGLSPQPSIQIVDSLAPDAAYAAFLEDLRRQPSQARLMCVGHHPYLGRIAARLVGADRPLRIEPSGVCRIDLDVSGPGHLIWFAPPWLISRVAD